MVDVAKFLEELKLDEPRNVRLDELEGLEGISVHATSNTCFILTETRHLGNICTGERFWFLPQEYRWCEEPKGELGEYILGIGRMQGEEAYVNHIFSLTEEDRKKIAEVFEIKSGGSYTTQGSRVRLMREGEILSVEHPGKLSNYLIKAYERPEVKEFFSGF